MQEVTKAHIKLNPSIQALHALGLHSLFPALGGTRRKGLNGRLGVIGGSQEYTGAPFFAGMSQLLGVGWVSVGRGLGIYHHNT